MKSFYNTLLRVLDEHPAVAIATITEASGSTPRTAGTKMIISPDGQSWFSVGGGIFEAKVIEDAIEAIQTGATITKSYSFNPDGKFAIGAVCGGKADVLIEPIRNTANLFIIGGGHVGQALASAASLLDFNITIIDDRPEFAVIRNPSVKGHAIHSADFSAIPDPTPDTYICLVSKGFTSDETALRRVIHSPAKYIGMIGSRRKIQTVYDHLIADGIDRALLTRIHAPIGEPIFSKSPEEIAISILAQIIRVRNQP